MRAHPPLVLAAAALAVVAGCAPRSAPSSGASHAARSCRSSSLPTLTRGTLTVGTDSPAYPPWFENNDPTNGKGYESAVAYAVAAQLGYGRSQVHWVKVPFNSSYAPGPKKFDFDINQISITPSRARVVDFSTGYYSAAQAVIALKGSKAASAHSVAGLRGLKLGAQTGTTSLSAIREGIKPTQQPAVFDDTNIAKQSLMSGNVDAIVADLPTALYLTAVEIPKGTIVGQFKDPRHAEQFGLLLQKGSGLTSCIDRAVHRLHSDGTIAMLEKRWLSQSVSVPTWPYAVQ